MISETICRQMSRFKMQSTTKQKTKQHKQTYKNKTTKHPYLQNPQQK